MRTPAECSNGFATSYSMDAASEDRNVAEARSQYQSEHRSQLLPKAYVPHNLDDA